MTGAAGLTALAALRADAGYVTLAVPEASLAARRVSRARAGQVGWRDDDALETIAGRQSAQARSPSARASVEAPSAVRWFEVCWSDSTSRPSWMPMRSSVSSPFDRASPTVLTPHAGELARLLDADATWVGEHRLDGRAAGCRALRRSRSPQGLRHDRCRSGAGVDRLRSRAPALATAGTGDVLTGVVAAFLSKGLEPACSSRARPWLTPVPPSSPHIQPGLLASDLLDGSPPGGLDSTRLSLPWSAFASFTLDLGAIRRNAETLLRAAGGAELWAVVKAEGYGHGRRDVSRAALEAGATALCVATLHEALALPSGPRPERPHPRDGPRVERESGEAARRARSSSLRLAGDAVPEGVPSI